MLIIRTLSTAVAVSGLPLERGSSSVVGRGRSGRIECCWSWSVRSDRPRPITLLSPRSNGKPETATAVDKVLMMGMRMPETCWAVFKRQAINLRDWCIWLVDLFECMMLHGHTNPKFNLPCSTSFQQETRPNSPSLNYMNPINQESSVLHWICS